MVYLNMTYPNINCPSGWQLTIVTTRESVAKLVPLISPVTQSSSLSVEETTLVCVALSEPTSTMV